MNRMDLAAKIAAYFETTERPSVVSVYLFGSHAEDRAHRESDIDVGVLLDREVVPTRKDRFDLGLRIASELGTALSVDDVDLVVLNDAPALFGRRIVTEGQRLYCRDPEADHTYVRDIQLRAADLRPFLERMRKIKLEALAPR